MLSSLQMEGLTIVVSPLISLIEDQMKKLPIELPAAWFIYLFIYLFIFIDERSLKYFSYY